MCRAPSVVMIPPGVRTGFDGLEPVAAIRVGEGSASAEEVGVERRVVGVELVLVAPGGVGLPHFDERAAHGTAIFVEHAPVNEDALSDGLACMLCRKVVVAFAKKRVSE